MNDLPNSFFPDDIVNQRILIAGGGGFIGGHLVADLMKRGCKDIVVADIKPTEQWYQIFSENENQVADLSKEQECMRLVEGCDRIYNLACNMGGMGFIELNKALCMRSVLINTHLLDAARHHGCKRLFFSSTACVYAADKQLTSDVAALKESDVYPAMPEDGYGWEKLFSERMCRHYMEDFDIQTRVARFHNVYGPYGTYDGGREKVPAALCRKIITSKMIGDHQLEIWGDGEQTRSFMYIDDCIHGIHLIMESEHWNEPINLGSSEMVSINQLADIIEGLAGITLQRNYKLDAPKGVRGRSSDNTLIKEVFEWEPSVSLREGLGKTYDWIFEKINSGSNSLK